MQHIRGRCMSGEHRMAAGLRRKEGLREGRVWIVKAR